MSRKSDPAKDRTLQLAHARELAQLGHARLTLALAYASRTCPPPSMIRDTIDEITTAQAMLTAAVAHLDEIAARDKASSVNPAASVFKMEGGF